MGAVLNAYTSHDLVAFHITCRAEVAPEAIDLLTDFVGRPKIDAEELDRERGVVIQEIARAHDQPSVVAEHLIDRAAFGEHPLGRPVLGPEEHLRTFSRDAILAFRRRQWAGARGGAFLVGNLEHLPENGARGALRPLPVDPGNGATSRRRPSRRRRWSRSATPTSRTCGCPTGPRSTRGRGASRADRLLDAAGRLDGLAPVRRDPRAARARLLGLRDRPRVRRRADPAALGGLDSAKCVEAYRGCARSSTSCATTGRPREVERARAYAAGRRVLAFENTNAVARHAAAQTVIFGQDIDPDAAIAALDGVTYDEVAEIARGISASCRSPASARTSSASSRRPPLTVAGLPPAGRRPQ